MAELRFGPVFMIHLQNICKTFGNAKAPAVRDITIRVQQGELLVLLGESGCGKTTTLKMINRLIEPTSGSVLIDEHNIAQTCPVTLRRSIGYVFQGVGLFPHMTVGENISITPLLLNWPKPQTWERVNELLELVNLPAAEYRDRLPSQLSGGQRQRVGVVRALAARPKIMLMDEPFGALDPLTRAALQEEFIAIHRQIGLTTVMVTHDMTEALLMSDRIGVMKNGRLLQLATPHELLTAPCDEYVCKLMSMPRQQAHRLELLIGNQSSEVSL